MKLYALIIVLLLNVGSVSAQYAGFPVVEKQLAYKDWSLKDLKTDKEVNLRQFAAGKRLVMVAYWAPWCGGSNFDAPFIVELYKKYHDKGLEVIGIAEYDMPEKMRSFVDQHKITYTNVIESTSSGDRERSPHFIMRREIGDMRKWGTPFYVFLEGSKLLPAGQPVLADKLFVVTGELKKTDTEKFIREKLGL